MQQLLQTLVHEKQECCHTVTWADLFLRPYHVTAEVKPGQVLTVPFAQTRHMRSSETTEDTLTWTGVFEDICLNSSKKGWGGGVQLNWSSYIQFLAYKSLDNVSNCSRQIRFNP